MVYILEFNIIYHIYIYKYIYIYILIDIVHYQIEYTLDDFHNIQCIFKLSIINIFTLEIEIHQSGMRFPKRFNDIKPHTIIISMFICARV